MVKKLKQTAASKAARGGVFDNALANSVKESAQRIWLAGLGAFSKAPHEGGKVFEALVKEGVSLQRKTQAVAEEKLGEVTSRMSNMAGDVGVKAGQQWDKLEAIFEERVAKSLNRLGVPSARDVDALIKRIDALGAQVASLSKGSGKAIVVETAARRANTGKAAKVVKAAAKAAPASPTPTRKVPARTSAKATVKRAPARARAQAADAPASSS